MERALQHTCLTFLVVLSIAGVAVAGDDLDPALGDLDPALWGRHAAALGSADRAIRRAAEDRLLDAGARALPVLAAVISSSEPQETRKRCVRIAARVGPPALPTAIALLASSDAWTRFHGVSILRDLATDAAAALPDLVRALGDESAAVAMESARALATMGDAASTAVPALARALGHRHRLVRVTAAGALAAIGPVASRASPGLVVALDDNDPSVRRASADALAAIGPDAVREAPMVVDALTRCLRDRSLYVRIGAAGALGGIGPSAAGAIPRLTKLAEEPALRAEVAWALRRIRGEVDATESPLAPSPAAEADSSVPTEPPAGAWPMLGGTPSRNAVALATKLPESWDLKTGRNVLWRERLGDETYGTPIVAGGRVFIGTGNERPRDPDQPRPCGVLMCFDAATGKFLWQDAALPLGRGIDTFLLTTNSSSPLVEGDRLWYLTAQCQLRCLDVDAFHDGVNDGPLRDEESSLTTDGDRIWELDLGAALGVFPHEAPNCSVVAVGDLLMVCTGNGVDEAHTGVPAPRAPSFLGVDKRSGEVVWSVVGPSPRVLHGQWSSPSVGVVHGRTLAFFGGGDGWLYALEAATGREVWRFDGNPKDAIWRSSGDIRGVVFRNNIIASPVFAGGVVYLAMGQDPNHGRGRGRLYAIDPGGSGDVTASRRIWERADVGRIIGPPIADRGLLYVADLDGIVHCLDSRSGETVWTHDLLTGVWGAILVADGKLWVGDEDGTLTALATGREKRVLGSHEMGASVYAAPTAVGGVLWVATARELIALARRD